MNIKLNSAACGSHFSNMYWVNVDINVADCAAFMWTVRICRGSSLQTYLAQYAHTLPPSILPIYIAQCTGIEFVWPC